MNPPGVGINDIIAVIKKCRDIYTSFTHEYESAPARVQELVDTCRYLTNLFGDVTAVDGGRFPAELHRTFTRKLQECNDFLAKYHTLKTEYQAEHATATGTDRLRDSWLAAWQTTRYAFAEQSVRELRDALELETVKLLAFIVTSMRNRATNSTSLSTSWQSDAISQSPPGYDPRWIEEMFKRLRSISNRYERETSASAQLLLAGTTTARQLDLSAIYGDMSSVWNEFCARAGLPESSRPPLLVDRLLMAPTSTRNDAIIEATRPSVHASAFAPLRNLQGCEYSVFPPGRANTLASESGWVPPSASVSARTDISSSSTISLSLPSASNATTPSIPASASLPFIPHFSLHSHSSSQSSFIPISPAVFHIAPVYVTLPTDKITLKEWRVDRLSLRPKIIWTAAKPPGVLEHSLPHNVFPNTLHSSQNKRLHVGFPSPRGRDDEHHLTWRRDDGVGNSEYRDIVPEYLFRSPEAHRDFQSDVRDKDLIKDGTFDTDVIWTDRTESRHDRRESYAQDLKLWRGRAGQAGSLSFNVTNGIYKDRHVECELRRLAPAARLGSNDLVYLDFIDGDRNSHGTAVSVSDEPGSPTGPPSLKRKRFSGIFSRGTEGGKLNKRSSSTSQKSVQLHLGDPDFFDDVQYLAIKFSNTENRDGRVVEVASQVAGRFKKLFDKHRKEDTERPSPVLPNLPFTTPMFGMEARTASPSREPQSSSRDVSPTSLPPPDNRDTPGVRAKTPSDLLLPHR